MIIESVDLKDYRNYKILNMNFNPQINIIYGDNAQGKTNILEALYVCATSRSHKGSKDREMIRMGSDEAHIKLNVKKNGLPYRIDMHLKKNKSKGIAVNGIPIKRAVELFGILNIVCFSPEDLSIIKNGPAERRRFMDMELSQCRPAYFYGLQQYNSALRQRNALLKGPPGTVQPEMLEIWDVQLSALGAQIMEARRAFVERLYAIAQGLHSRLSGGKETLGLAYAPNVAYGPGQDVEGLLLQALTQSAREDIRRGFTTVGPHRDDLAVYIGDVDVRAFGSQGQQRTAALSIKLSELALLQEETGETPVLLLDDVLSELDPSRQRFLMESVAGCQCFLTCTALEGVRGSGLEVGAVYRCQEGTLQKE